MRTTRREDGAGGRLAQQMAIAQAMAGQNVRLHRPPQRDPRAKAEAAAASTRVLISAAVLLIAVAVLALLASG